MRISGNRLEDIADFYHRELIELYPGAEIDAILKLAAGHYLGITRIEAGIRLTESEIVKLYDCALELRRGKPIQYILEEAWFFDLKLRVGPDVLIPRPETEELTDIVIKENGTAESFLDIGTGSGCIALAISSRLTSAKVKACDISETALGVAKANASNLNLAVEFFKADILTEEALKKEGEFEVIVSNPPYVLDSERDSLAPHVLRYEPSKALFTGSEDGLIFYRKITDICVRHLRAGGRLYLELNPLTATEVEQLMRNTGLFNSIHLLNDMSGKTRFLKAIKKS